MPLNKDGKLCGNGRHYKQYCFTTQDIAELLDLSISRVRHLIAEGKLSPTLKGIMFHINPINLSLNDKVNGGKE